MRISIFLISGLCISSLSFAQTSDYTVTDKAKLALYHSTPVWKEMIADTNANYFEVQKAFELFWEGKELPTEEDEIIGEKRKLKNNFINRTFNATELKAQLLKEELAFDYKKYRWWLMKTEPYVKEDGSIMTPSERLQLWKQQQEEANTGNK